MLITFRSHHRAEPVPLRRSYAANLGAKFEWGFIFRFDDFNITWRTQPKILDVKGSGTEGGATP